MLVLVVVVVVISVSSCLFFTGRLVANYCPSVSGCRGVIEFKDVADMQTVEVTDEQLRLAFNSSHATVFLVHN